MHLSISHETTYRYEHPASYSIQVLRLTPRGYAGQSILRWEVTGNGRLLTPNGEDGFGNPIHTMTTQGDHQSVTIRASGDVITTNTDGVVGDAMERFPPLLYKRFTDYTAVDDRLAALADKAGAGAKDELDLAHRLMTAVRDAVEYDTTTTESSHTATEALALGAGVCQDHAHIFIACARHLSLPARYVSGYLWSEGAVGPHEAGHAWAEAYVPDLGWVGFDVANRLCPTEDHVRVAVGLDYLNAAPVRGLRYGAADEILDVQVHIQQGYSQ